MSHATTPQCEDCGTTSAVRPYDDPETHHPVLLCVCCARSLSDDGADDTAGLSDSEQDPDEEFRDTCITAADYFREGDY